MHCKYITQTHLGEIYEHAFYVCAIWDTLAFSLKNYGGFNTNSYCSDVCGYHTLAGFCVLFCWLGSSGEQPTSVPYFSCLALSGAEGCWIAVTKKWSKLQFYFHVSKQKCNTYWVRSWRRALFPPLQKFIDGAYVCIMMVAKKAPGHQQTLISDHLKPSPGIEKNTRRTCNIDCQQTHYGIMTSLLRQNDVTLT